MSHIIEAKAVITGVDKTGAMFDKIAKKLEGIAKTGKSFEGIKSFQRGGMGFGPQFQKDIDALKLTQRELANVHKSWEALNSTMSRNGPMAASKYFGAVDQWKRKTLTNLREVRSGMDETEKHHKKFFAGAGRFAMHAVGIGGAAYVTGHAVRNAVGASAERSREAARYGLGGFSDAERQAAEDKAAEISAKYPSVGGTEVLAHIRQLRARLGDFGHAVDNVEALTKAQVVLKTLGGGDHAGEDLEKLVLGLESQGIGAQPEKFKSYLNAFVRAKSLFPDLRGEDFRQYMQRSNSSKYGLSEDYLTNVAPTLMQHEGASNFGVSQASAFSALIGGRQTKSAKAMMRSFGLLDDKDNLVNKDQFIANPYDWMKSTIRPSLVSKGITMDEDHRGEMVEAMTKMFSNRKVAEFFASMLVNASVIEKDKLLLKRAKGTEAADQVRRDDPYVALAGVKQQFDNVAAALIGLKPAVAVLNDAAGALGNIAKTFKDGKPPEGTGARAVYDAFEDKSDEVGVQSRIDRVDRQIARAPSKAEVERLRVKRGDLEAGLNAVKNAKNMPPVFTAGDIARLEEQEREDLGHALPPGTFPLPRRDPRKVFLPERDPRRGDFPATQPLDDAPARSGPTKVDISTNVEGKAEITIGLSSEALAVYGNMKRLVNFVGQSIVKMNGPGSTGRSSPDAAAPSTGVGVPVNVP